MENTIQNIEYIIPVPDKPIGTLKFDVEILVPYRAEQKMLAEGEDSPVSLSEETQKLLVELGQSIIKDLEK